VSCARSCDSSQGHSTRRPTRSASSLPLPARRTGEYCDPRSARSEDHGSPCRWSLRRDTVRASISQLHTLPELPPVNASMAALRPATHDSGPGRLATPFLYDSFIHNSTPVYPGALSILLEHRSTEIGSFRSSKKLRQIFRWASDPPVSCSPTPILPQCRAAVDNSLRTPPQCSRGEFRIAEYQEAPLHEVAWRHPAKTRCPAEILNWSDLPLPLWTTSSTNVSARAMAASGR
jgi:hypothetical protein